MIWLVNNSKFRLIAAALSKKKDWSMVDIDSNRYTDRYWFKLDNVDKLLTLFPNVS